MSEIIAIEGGHKLNGTVEISGAKNATVALIPAIILADSPVTIYGVPAVSYTHLSYVPRPFSVIKIGLRYLSQISLIAILSPIGSI